jgi:hypothetical protein
MIIGTMIQSYMGDSLIKEEIRKPNCRKVSKFLIWYELKAEAGQIP